MTFIIFRAFQHIVDRFRLLCIYVQFGKRFDDNAVLSEEGDVDSLGFIMVLTELEDKLGVTIPDEEWDGMRTFGDLVNKFVSKIKGEKAE